MKKSNLFIVLALIGLNLLQFFLNVYSDKGQSSIVKSSEGVNEENLNKFIEAVYKNDSSTYYDTRVDIIMSANTDVMFFYSFIMFMEHGNIKAAEDMYTILSLKRVIKC